MGSTLKNTIPSGPPRRPRIAITLGDPAGIGPELVAKLLHNAAAATTLAKADIFLLANQDEVAAAEAAAGGLEIPVQQQKQQPGGGVQLLADDNQHNQREIPLAQVSREAGDRTIHQLARAVALAKTGHVDAIVFAPLNKSSLKLAGMHEEDELRWFAKQLHYEGTTSEINIAGDLWTARVTSHVGIEKVAGMVTRESTFKAIELLHRLRYVCLHSLPLFVELNYQKKKDQVANVHTYRWESGIENPRLAVCALNPHAGENGNFGRHEIDHIAPAVRDAQQQGMDVTGPFPCDTIFRKRAHFDGIVTMYHDQGQIAMKLLDFDGGVTVQGGLPVVIATPAHGTAFDIVGKNVAGTQSMQNAFDVAVTMAERRLAAQSQESG